MLIHLSLLQLSSFKTKLIFTVIFSQKLSSIHIFILSQNFLHLSQNVVRSFIKIEKNFVRILIFWLKIPLYAPCLLGLGRHVVIIYRFHGSQLVPAREIFILQSRCRVRNHPIAEQLHNMNPPKTEIWKNVKN